MAHLCVPQNQALGVCRGSVPDIQICGTHGRKDLVNATIISNAEEEDVRRREIANKEDKLLKCACAPECNMYKRVCVCVCVCVCVNVCVCVCVYV